jgi:hypothetical protein
MRHCRNEFDEHGFFVDQFSVDGEFLRQWGKIISKRTISPI